MYLTLLPNTTEVEVTQGFAEDTETTTIESRDAALVIANRFNQGRYHPDVYVIIKLNGKELQQVVSCNTIIGFVEQE